MIRNLTLLLLFLFSWGAVAQAIYRKFPSEVYNGERNVKILKPRNYKSNPEKKYPLVVVLDGDYLFEPVAGMVDYMGYWDQMPESFVLGVNQKGSREADTGINSQTGMPDEPAGKFMQFLEKELIPTMQKEYRVAPFTIIVGKGETANLANYFLMRKKTEIRGFLNINPIFTKVVKENLESRLNRLNNHTFYYTATVDGDANDKDYGKAFSSSSDSTFTANEKMYYKKESFKGVDRYGLAANAIPNGLQFIFKKFRLVNIRELLEDVESTNEEYSTDEDGEEIPEEDRMVATAVQKLQERYDDLRLIYQVRTKVRMVDIITVANYLEEEEDWQQLITLAYLAQDEHPDKNAGFYLEGLAEQGLKNKERALSAYKKAYEREPSGGVSKSMVYDRVSQLSSSGK